MTRMMGIKFFFKKFKKMVGIKEVYNIWTEPYVGIPILLMAVETCEQLQILVIFLFNVTD